MRIPLWLLVLLFLGWSAWAINQYYCVKCGCCGARAATTEAETNTTGVPLFRWKAENPESDSKFAEWKKSLLGRGGQGDTLVITGWYRTGEGEALGMTRAQALGKLMMPEMPASRVRFAGKQVSDNLAEGSAPMESADFSWLKLKLKKEEGAIIESDNDITFLFPFNSTERDRDPKVEDYLKKLVEKHKGTQATFLIVGHTDNVGDEKQNTAFGMRRAQAIAKTLTGYGLAKSRLQIESKGMSAPVADNSTEDGRHQNRRVVITVKQ